MFWDYCLLLTSLVLQSDRNQEVGFEPCSKLEDLNLEVGRNSVDKERVNLEGESSRRYRAGEVCCVHSLPAHLFYISLKMGIARYLVQSFLCHICS